MPKEALFNSFSYEHPYFGSLYCKLSKSKRISEYDQEITQLDIADQPMTQYGRATTQYHSQDIRKTIKAKQPAIFSPSR